MKMRIDWDSGTTTIVDVATTQKLAKNFTVKELANNKATDEIKMISTPRSRKFLDMLQSMRNKFGSMTINSNYRTTSFNNSVGGDAKSRHLYAEAADWWLGKAKMTDTRFTQIKTEWERLCLLNGEIGAINRYTDGVHLEIGSDISFGSTSFAVRDYRGKTGDW